MKKFIKKFDGFTIIETTVAMVIFLLVITATMSLYKFQSVYSSRIEQESEMQDNLRMAAYWLAKDLKEASEIIQLGDGTGNNGNGPGPGLGSAPDYKNAFQLRVRVNGVNDQRISYFYKNSDKSKKIFYRAIGDPPNPKYQPISNEYIFNGTNYGYIAKWEIRFYDENDDEIIFDDENNSPTKDEDVVKRVKRVEFTLYGAYPNCPNLFPMRTSVKMRVGSTL